MQKLRLKILQVPIKADYVAMKNRKAFDNFVFISLKLWGEKYRLVILLEE